MEVINRDVMILLCRFIQRFIPTLNRAICLLIRCWSFRVGLLPQTACQMFGCGRLNYQQDVNNNLYVFKIKEEIKIKTNKY